MNKSLEKFFLLFGILWLAICSAVFIPGLAIADELGGIGIMLAFAIPFTLIGVGFIVYALHAGAKRKKFLKEGTLYYGKIVSYQTNNSIQINGSPLVYLEVRYYDRNGRIGSVSVSTGSRNGYNLGETVQIAEYNGEVILISDRSQNTLIQGEENLIMTYNSGAQSIAQIRPESFPCPHCGANLMIARGQTAKCPYCESFVTNNRQFA